MNTKIIISLLLTATVSFAFGWIYAYKRLPPSPIVAKILRTYFFNYERGEQKASSERINLSATNPDIIFLGDSLTAHGKFSEFFSSPPRIYNRGVDGDTAFDILDRLENIISLKPKAVYLMIGINDFHRGAHPQQVANNIKQIHNKLEKEGIDVLLQKTIQCQKNKCSYIKEVNELNKIISSIHGYNVIDLGELNSTNGLNSSLTYDGIHLNLNGYKVWKEQLLRAPNGNFE